MNNKNGGAAAKRQPTENDMTDETPKQIDILTFHVLRGGKMKIATSGSFEGLETYQKLELLSTMISMLGAAQKEILAESRLDEIVPDDGPVQ